MVIISSPLGFAGTTIHFAEVPFPTDLTDCRSFVGHPATRQLLEALGAVTDNTGRDGAPGKWAGPAVGETYLAVPLASNPRADGWTPNVAVESVKELRAIRCTRIR
jgi:hypothetical protein